MFRPQLMIAAFLLAFQAAVAMGQDQPKGLLSIGIGKVKTLPAVADAAAAAGTTNQMQRVVEALDSQLIDRFHGTRKFTVVSRSDLDEVLGEQKLAASGNVDESDDAAAQAFKLAGCKFLVVMTVDNFQDYTATATFAGTGESAHKRVVQFSAVTKLYDTTTGKLLESTNYQCNNKEALNDPSYQQAHGDLTEALFQAMSRLMAQKVVDRVIDVLRPAKVIARTDTTVTINRGDGTSIWVGEIWNAYAQGKEMVDPDTGASLGHEELKVGSIRITEVDPLFSKGEVVDDHGVDTGQVLRSQPGQTQPPEAAEAPATPPQ
jgi:curli biogenesis system outer membrane secretion channel CsgG